jgi:hypothetical protein
MSYYAILDYDESLGGDVASNQGWSDFVKFVDRFVVPGDSTIHDLTRMGVCDDVDTLRLELQEYTGQDPTVDELLRIVPVDVPSGAVLVVTDGAGLSADGVEELVYIAKNLSGVSNMNDSQRESKAASIIGNTYRTDNAFPPSAGGAPSGGATRPKLDMPLLPENLRIADGEGDPNAVEVSREDLLKIKEVIDRLLAESGNERQSQDATEEPTQTPDGQAPQLPGKGPMTDGKTPPKVDPQAAGSTDSTVPEKTFPTKKTQDDINGGDAPSQDAPVAEEDPLKRKYKGFFNAT